MYCDVLSVCPSVCLSVHTHMCVLAWVAGNRGRCEGESGSLAHNPRFTCINAQSCIFASLYSRTAVYSDVLCLSVCLSVRLGRW